MERLSTYDLGYAAVFTKHDKLLRLVMAPSVRYRSADVHMSFTIYAYRPRIEETSNLFRRNTRSGKEKTVNLPRSDPKSNFKTYI
jgi:hypothetical protein